MNFKQWLVEWEGCTFNQESDLVNGKQYPNSKYKGKGERDSMEIGDGLKQIQKKFGFKDDDEILKMQQSNIMQKPKQQRK